MLRNHGVNFGENRIEFTLINGGINVGIVMKFGMNLYFAKLNHIMKFCEGRPIIASKSKVGYLKKIYLSTIISSTLYYLVEIRHEHVSYICVSFYHLLYYDRIIRATYVLL